MMVYLKLLIPLVLFILIMSVSHIVFASNESSYIVGYWAGSNTGPNNGQGNSNSAPYDPSKCKLRPSDTTFWPKNDVEPTVTNQTSCKDGWLDGWKSWCLKNGQDCAQNMTIGNFPPQILEAYKWYQIGANEATGKNDCPITSNGAFCAGCRSNNTSWYDTEGCSDSYPASGPFSSNLVGCPLDALNQTGMAKPHILVGTWNYLNESSNKIHLVVRGTIVFSSLGNFTLTIPNHSGFGPFTQEWSWGLQNDTKHPNILTFCGDGITGCDNETMVSTSLNHAVIKDLHGDLISLTKNSGYPFSLIGVRLMDDLLSRTNKNGTILPGATFNPYIDLSNPNSSRPFVTAINDSSFQWKPREINETKTMWNMFNSTSDSNGTIIFTDCTVPNINGSWIQCPKEPPIFYRELNNNLHKGIWSLVYPIEKTGMTPVLELCTWYGHCNNLIVQKISKDYVQLKDSHGGKLYLTDPVTPKGTNRTISIDQANKLLNENRNITAYAKCIATGHDWDAGQCMSGKIVAITGPTVCHHTSEGQTCESGSVVGSGWIPVKYINHTAPDPGCTRLTDHPNYESCVDGTMRSLTDKGISLGDLGNHTGAIEYYDKALAINPKYENALYNKGYDLAALGNYTEAILYYDKALALNPNDTYALDNKGVALGDLGNHTGAVQYYDNALGIDPNDTYALYNKGLADANLGNYTGAIIYYDKALAINPKYENALYNKGLSLDDLGNHTGALKYYDKVLAIDPNDEDALSSKGLSLDDLGNHTGAIIYYDRALTIDPKDENTLYNKGVALGNLGNYTGAIIYYDKALAINPNDKDALGNKGADLDALGNHTGAIEYYDKVLGIDPHNVIALNGKGAALANLGNYTGAILYYDKALAIQPNDTYALNNKGAALNNLGNYSGAIKYYDKALAIEPKDTFALTNKAAILDILRNNTTSRNAANPLEYRNSIYGIKIKYPSDWRVEGSRNPSIIASFYPESDYRSDIIVQVDNLTTNYTPDQYLNSVMLGDAADYKHFPDIRFNQNSTNNMILAGHPGYLLNGTFRDPTSDALQRFTNIGTIIGDKVYSIIYYSPAETYPVYRTIYDQMIKSFEVIPQNSSAATSVSTYDNRNYGMQIQYPSDWSVQESKSSGELINVATFVSPTGPDSDPTADVSIYLDKLHNSTTTLVNYAHFVAFTDYENRPSYFHAFKLLELSTNSSTIAGKPTYTLIGTYQDRSAGLQKLMETGTIIGDKVYSVQYIADAPKYSDYLPTVQKMIDSLVIKKSSSVG